MFNTQVFLESVPALIGPAIVAIQLTACASLLSLVFGTLSAMLQLSGMPPGYWMSRAYVSIMRGTPLLASVLSVWPDPPADRRW